MPADSAGLKGRDLLQAYVVAADIRRIYTKADTRVGCRSRSPALSAFGGTPVIVSGRVTAAQDHFGSDGARASLLARKSDESRKASIKQVHLEPDKVSAIHQVAYVYDSTVRPREHASDLRDGRAG